MPVPVPPDFPPTPEPTPPPEDDEYRIEGGFNDHRADGFEFNHEDLDLAWRAEEFPTKPELIEQVFDPELQRVEKPEYP